ncbi:hypothetical protein B0A48_07720 [Cryoendolithus antarcticus]|uniref:F-box domain-containing protein n=1 Tax=Cryoendolithus antarcticus TaxID=1507870 RepID=A0A1V8T7J9_9PEZI|nr:hypothetical protein B0A48_07720 [Cryoendolithus antarcticus]
MAFESELDRLRAENEALRKALKAINAITLPHVGKSVPKGVVLDFFDLPTEIRDQILEYCVVVGTVIIRPPGVLKRHDMRQNRPDAREPLLQHAETQLFCVSKVMRNQAAKIYLARNKFVVLPTRGEHIPLYYIPSGARAGWRYVRRLSITLDCRALAGHFRPRFNSIWASYDTAELSDVQRKDLARHVNHQIRLQGHKSVISAAHQYWRNIFHAITGKFTRLEYLEINMQIAGDPDLEHRLAADVFRARGTLRKGTLFGSWLKTKEVKFYGGGTGPISYSSDDGESDGDFDPLVEIKKEDDDDESEIDVNEVETRRLRCDWCSEIMDLQAHAI